MHLMAFLENGAYDEESSPDEEATDSVVTVLPWGSAQEATYWGGACIPPEILASRSARVEGDKAANEAVERSRARRSESPMAEGQPPEMIEVADTLLEGDGVGPMASLASQRDPGTSTTRKRPATDKRSGVVQPKSEGKGSQDGKSTKQKKTVVRNEGKGQGEAKKGKNVDKATKTKGDGSGSKSQGKKDDDLVVKEKGTKQHVKFKGKGTVRAEVRAEGRAARPVSSTLGRDVARDVPSPGVGNVVVALPSRARISKAAKGSASITEFMRK